MRETQATISTWISETFPGGDPESARMALRALEEVAEFVRVAALLLHSDCVLAPRHRRSLN